MMPSNVYTDRRARLRAATCVTALALGTVVLGACAPTETVPAPTEAAQAAQTEQAEPPVEPPPAPPTSQPATGDHAGHDHAGHDHAAEAPVEHNHEEMENVLAEGEYDPADVVAQPGAEVGDITRCPVSGEVFVVTADSTYLDHEGQDVYFCCSSCIRRFQRDPARYLEGGTADDGAEGPMVEVSADGSRYEPPVAKSRIPDGAWICDMGTVHYASLSEGTCPICNMRLTQP
jgi:YHS domain-containing protein